MSQENVEIVRCYFDAVKRGLDVYWENPRSAVAAIKVDDLAPEQREVLQLTHPDMEWTNAFGLTFKGHLGLANGVDQLLEAADDYSIKLQEATDLGGDHVLAVVHAAMKGKGSEIEVSETVYSLMRLREGLIVRSDEYLDRTEALEAVGLRE